MNDLQNGAKMGRVDPVVGNLALTMFERNKSKKIGQNVAHLIVAVFWSASGQKILVQVERCYTDPERQEIVREPVLEKEEDYELNLAQFPEKLKNWIKITTNKLESVYHNFEQPWQLTIDLLVPIDLLNGSLIRWCGETSRLPQEYPIIVRSSDRFDIRLEEKAYFYKMHSIAMMPSPDCKIPSLNSKNPLVNTFAWVQWEPPFSPPASPASY
jgi:hypothetical protein